MHTVGVDKLVSVVVLMLLLFPYVDADYRVDAPKNLKSVIVTVPSQNWTPKTSGMARINKGNKKYLIRTRHTT
eukprot:3285279-Amphidinium_carterae.1